MKLLHAAAALGLITGYSAAAAGQAQTSVSAAQPLSPGVTIFDPQGGEVGKIESIAGESVVLDTGTSKATLPKTAFGTSPKGPTVNATKAQIDTMVADANAKSSAALAAAMVPGAQIHGQAGALVGTVKEISGENIVIDRPAGLVTLTKKAFALGANGLTISMTSAELDAAAKAAQVTQSTS